MSDPLLIVDVQSGFINPFTHHIPQRVARLIQRDEYAPILFTRFINSPDGPYQRFLDWHSCDREPETKIAPELESFVDQSCVFSKQDCVVCRTNWQIICVSKVLNEYLL